MRPSLPAQALRCARLALTAAWLGAGACVAADAGSVIRRGPRQLHPHVRPSSSPSTMSPEATAPEAVASTPVPVVAPATSTITSRAAPAPITPQPLDPRELEPLDPSALEPLDPSELEPKAPRPAR